MIHQRVSNWPLIRSRLNVDIVESTNDLAKEFLNDKDVLPLLVVAHEQTKGRGRGENQWWSDEGSLIVSFVLDPLALGISRDKFPLIGLAFALGVLDAMCYTEPRAQLRWPNDIEVGGKKLGGILPELVETEDGPRMIVGLGMNLTTSFVNAPIEISKMATSLASVWDVNRCPFPTTDEFLREIAFDTHMALGWLRDGSMEFAKRLNVFDSLRGQSIAVDLGETIVRGIGIGIDDQGGLKIQAEDRVHITYGGRVLR